MSVVDANSLTEKLERKERELEALRRELATWRSKHAKGELRDPASAPRSRPTSATSSCSAEARRDSRSPSTSRR